MPVKTNLDKLTARRAELEQQLKAINDEITEHKANELVTVTDHAVLRYLERMEGYNIEQLRQLVCPLAIRKQIIKLGGKGKFPVANKTDGTNHIVAVENHKVVTVHE